MLSDTSNRDSRDSEGSIAEENYKEISSERIRI